MNMTPRQQMAALRKDPGYKWLLSNFKAFKTLMERRPTHDSSVELQFMRDLVSHLRMLIIVKGAKVKQPRSDKRRHAMCNDFDRVIHHLLDGVVQLTPITLNVLVNLLHAAKYELQQPRRKTVKHPELRSFARSFLRPYNIADTDILLEIASALDLECDRSTAERYINS
jgi:hypothetical protein